VLLQPAGELVQHHRAARAGDPGAARARRDAGQKALEPLSPKECEMFVATLRAYEDELAD
jgi:hypothetical protein